MPSGFSCAATMSKEAYSDIPTRTFVELLVFEAIQDIKPMWVVFHNMGDIKKCSVRRD